MIAVKRTKYAKLRDYEAFIFGRDTTVRFACCDCGLVHDMVVVDEKRGQHGVAFRRNKRATAQLRRYNYGYLQHTSPLRFRMIKID